MILNLYCVRFPIECSTCGASAYQHTGTVFYLQIQETKKTTYTPFRLKASSGRQHTARSHSSSARDPLLWVYDFIIWRRSSIWWPPKAMCFLFLFLVTFFLTKPTRAHGKKMPKEKKTLAQCPRLPDRQITYRTYCVERSHSFVYVLPNNDRINSFQSPRKFDFSWYLTSLRGQRTCSNLQPKRSIASKTSLLSAESTFDDFNRKDLGFWFSVTRQCNSLAST